MDQTKWKRIRILMEWRTNFALTNIKSFKRQKYDRTAPSLPPYGPIINMVLDEVWLGGDRNGNFREVIRYDPFMNPTSTTAPP